MQGRDGGADTFIFADGFGSDVVSDFTPAEAGERIDLSGVSAIADYATLTDPGRGHIVQAGADVQIADLSGNTITLRGVTLAELSQDDFLF